MKNPRLCLTFLCVTLLVAAELRSAPPKAAPAAEQFMSYDQLDEQPTFPKFDRLWDKVQFPLLEAFYKYPAVAVIRIAIDAKGRVKTAELLQASEKDFGIEAVKSVKSWKIVPGRKAGQAVACLTVVTLRAELTPKAGKYDYRRSGSLADPRKTEAQK